MRRHAESETILAGRYRILRLIGRGGTSAVWLAEKTDQPGGPFRPGHFGHAGMVALKIPSDETCFELIRREAELLSSLHHSGIPKFVELLEADAAEIEEINRAAEIIHLTGGTGDPGSADDRERRTQRDTFEGNDPDRTTEEVSRAVPCLVMEFIRGKSLREILGGESDGNAAGNAGNGLVSAKDIGRNQHINCRGEADRAAQAGPEGFVHAKRLDVNRTLEIGEAVCEILEYLHGRNPPVYYLDLKPANLICTSGGSVVLLDLGSAAGVGMGTEGYAAPELYNPDQKPTACSDIYSLGAVLHECLSGITPMQSGLRPLGESDPAYAGSMIENILICCCSTSPSIRWSDATALRRQLAAAAGENIEKRRAMRLLISANNRTALPSLEHLLYTAYILAFFALLFTVAGKCLFIYRYVSLLQRAQKAASFEQKTELYRDAVQLCPADADGYEHFVNEITNDGVLLPREQDAFDSIMQAEAVGRKGAETCEEVLREESPQQYEKLMFLIGRRCYACGQYGDRTNRYLLLAAEGTMLSASDRRDALLLAEMSEIVKNGVTSDLLSDIQDHVETPVNLGQAWSVMVEIESEAEHMGQRGKDSMTAAAVYRDLGGILGLYCPLMSENGIPAAEMERMMRNGELFLKENAGKLAAADVLLVQAQSAVEEAERVLYCISSRTAAKWMPCSHEQTLGHWTGQPV